MKNLKLTKQYKDSLILTKIQQDIFVGLILGHLNISYRNYNNGTKYPCLEFCQSNLHKPYFDHLINLFSYFINSLPRFRISNKAW